MGGLKTEVDTLYNALINGPAVQITRQPLGLIGIALTGSGHTTGAYDYAAAGGNQVQLIAAGANVGLWVCGGGLENPSIDTSETYVLWFGRGAAAAAVLLGELQFETLEETNVGQYDWTTVFFPFPLYVAANVAVCLDLANGTAVDVTANGHGMIMTGLGA